MEDKGNNKRDYDIQSFYIKFESNDSQVSDGSYESSLSSNQQNNTDNIEYFRQEMSRFFINYPQLMNNQLLDKKGVEGSEDNHWTGLANEIFKQAKQDQVSLQSIAKRIAYYRQKAQEVDIIDLIAKEKDIILKELDEEASTDLNQHLLVNKEHQKRSSSLGVDTTDNVYYSWKKKNQRFVLDKSQRNSHRGKSTEAYNIGLKEMGNTMQSRIQKNDSQSKKRRISRAPSGQTPKVTNQNKKFQKFQRKTSISMNKKQIINSHQLKVPNSNPNSTFQNSKNIFKFEPKTEVGKQLVEEIKRVNAQDQIGIKKTIVNFVAKYRQNLQKQMLEKATLPQRLSKLHIEDSKQLLLFCPMKKQNSQTDMPLNNQTEEFIDILKQISQGHLMKYWRLLQQKKL